MVFDQRIHQGHHSIYQFSENAFSLVSIKLAMNDSLTRLLHPLCFLSRRHVL